jgi:SAM-dependent methyltransferase
MKSTVESVRRRTWRARSRAGLHRRRSDDGLPLPPPHLRALVAVTPDAEWFLECGRLAVSAMARALGKHGARIEDRQAILDFGCGCGRVTRHLRAVPGDVHGTDIDAALVRWCRGKLRFGTFETNSLRPPLDYPTATFDLVYAFSVFTHLPLELQRPWIDELRRVSRPGGLVVITTHGEAFRPKLTVEEDKRYEAGELVVRNEQRAGRNECAVFHPESWVREHLADRLHVVAKDGWGAPGEEQDLYLLQVGSS